MDDAVKQKRCGHHNGNEDVPGIIQMAEVSNDKKRKIGFVFFFLNDTATTEIYPLPLHAALPISRAEKKLGVSKPQLVKVSNN